MALQIDKTLRPAHFAAALDHFFALSGPKILLLHETWDPVRGAPVFTQRGEYSSRGWTEWTQGFQFGCQILQFDATGDERFLALGRDNVRRFMPPHLTHTGVHDHGFNTVSTYGNLWRLAKEGRGGDSPDAVERYELAIKLSGAVQAARWTALPDGGGFIHSFNGPHSLFADTLRTCRVLVLADLLGHLLLSEGDRRIVLLERAMQHMRATAKFNVYYGKDRDIYDVRGRVAHESIFNIADGSYRCPGTQQGYSPFSTWTRGLAWVLLGAAEQLEFFSALRPAQLKRFDDKNDFKGVLWDAALATADFYIENSPADGIPYWDTGAPGLARMGDYLARPAEPENPFEPVDSSAAAIAAQGLLRLGSLLEGKPSGKKYTQAGFTIARALFAPPYLSEDPRHQGLLRHAVYHRPNGWDYVPKGRKTPQGEAAMWGDYHAMELALWLRRAAAGQPPFTFFGP